MKLLSLEYGFVMDEETKVVYKIKDGNLIPSSQEEYDRCVRFIHKLASLWNDAIEIEPNDLPEDLYFDEVKNVLFKVEDDCIVVYKIDGGSEFLEPKIYQLVVTSLEDVKCLLSNESIIQCLVDLNGFDPKIDGKWRMEFVEYCDATYKISYNIDRLSIKLGIKKIVVKSEPANIKIRAKKVGWLNRG